jgi:uncharacterized protein YkwD
MLKNALKWILKFLTIFILVNLIAASVFFMLNYKDLRGWYIKSKTGQRSQSSGSLEDRLYNPFDNNSFEKTLSYGQLDCGNFENNEISGKMFTLINTDRVKQGLTPYTWSKKLCESAILKANDMAKKSYFEHVSPEGISPTYWIDTVGYVYSSSGENLALNTYTASEAHEGLMNSPGHRANILDSDFTQIGIAYSWGKIEGQDAFFVVEHFGSPQSAEAQKTKTICQDKDEVEKLIKNYKKQKNTLEEYLDDTYDMKAEVKKAGQSTKKIDDYISDSKEKERKIDDYIEESLDYLGKCDN